MEEFYRAIEERIAASGYPQPVSGESIYSDICDRIEDKEPGEYILLSKPLDDTTYEYHITVYEENFNLGIMVITCPSGSYTIDFDA